MLMLFFVRSNSISSVPLCLCRLLVESPSARYAFVPTSQKRYQHMIERKNKDNEREPTHVNHPNAIPPSLHLLTYLAFIKPS
jgi:hypothetical protein